jgi:hypothetical protein
MDNGIEEIERKVFKEYCDLVARVQPALDKHYFYDLMPCWDDFRQYRLEELKHQRENILSGHKACLPEAGG